MSLNSFTSASQHQVLGNMSYLQALAFGPAKPHLLQMWLETTPVVAVASGTVLYWPCCELRLTTRRDLRGLLVPELNWLCLPDVCVRLAGALQHWRADGQARGCLQQEAFGMELVTWLLVVGTKRKLQKTSWEKLMATEVMRCGSPREKHLWRNEKDLHVHKVQIHF